MTRKSERHVWHETERGWKKDGKIIPFESMSNRDLKKLKRFMQYRELQLLNKAFVIGDKLRELEAEADKRGMVIKDVNTAYHSKVQG